MEGSKCRKCGEKPHFVEHIEKWYCFNCNTYQDDVPEEKAAETAAVVEQHAVEETTVAAPVAAPAADDEKPSPIAAEIEEIEKEESEPKCEKCGAILQKKDDGTLFCAMCAPSVEPAAAEVIESKTPSIIDIAIAEHLATTVKAEPEPVPVEEIPKASPEAKPEVVEVKVRMCPNCGQPLKYIEKYSRYYCYSCKKYAPKEPPEAPKAAPAAKAPEAKKCPDCGGDLKFIDKYSEWYCYTCKKYPLRQKKAAEKKAAEKPVTAAAPASKPAEKASSPPACTKCGKPLKHVEKYDRYYCFECKQYAPKGHGQAEGAKQEKKTCPVCNGDMAYIQQYNEWYCYKCKKYTLRPSKPVLLI